jgi:hypothetical protein
VNNGHILDRNLKLLKSYEREGWERTVDNHTAYCWHVA